MRPKKLGPWLALSLALNATCLAAWLLTRSPARGTGPDDTATSAARTITAAPSTPQIPQLISDTDLRDLDRLVARLRAAGCPPRELSAILYAKIRGDTEEIMYRGYMNQPYWSGKHPYDLDPEWRRAIDERLTEHPKLFKKFLLTPELFAANDQLLDDVRDRFGNFAPDTVRRLMLATIDVEIELSEIRRKKAVQSSSPGVDRHTPSNEFDDNFETRQLAAIKSALSVDEFAAYELRSSRFAGYLRERSSAFQPSEDEYKLLFAAEKTYRETFVAQKLNAEEKLKLRAQTDAQVLAALPPDRAADYATFLKTRETPLPRLIARLNLPVSTIRDVQSVQQATLAQAAELRTDSSLTPPERDTQLAALRAAARAKLGATLRGDRGLNAYEIHAGSWLQTLEQTEPSTP